MPSNSYGNTRFDGLEHPVGFFAPYGGLSLTSAAIPMEALVFCLNLLRSLAYNGVLGEIALPLQWWHFASSGGLICTSK